MKYIFLPQYTKQIPVQSEDITIQFPWQEFNCIVILLL